MKTSAYAQSGGITLNTWWEKELLAYIDSKDHKHNCPAYWDDRECCLEKDWILRFIRRVVDVTIQQRSGGQDGAEA